MDTMEAGTSTVRQAKASDNPRPGPRRWSKDRGVGPSLAHWSSGVSVHSAVAPGVGHKAAYFPMFHSPASVDNRAVRMGRVIMFFITTACAVFVKRGVVPVVVLGLFVEFLLTVAGLPSPIAILASIPYSGTRPDLSPGTSTQFSKLCGLLVSGAAWASLAGDQPNVARVFLALLAIAALVQSVSNISMGGVVLDFLRESGVVNRAVNSMHVNTRANTMYAWEKKNIRTGKGVSPEATIYRTMGVPANPTDLRAKPSKEAEKWQRFHLIKYCHISYFGVPLSMLGLSVPWAILSTTVGTPPPIWQALAWTGVCLQMALLVLYGLKCALYPTKVKKEWCNPGKHNAFAVPFLNVILMAWLALRWPAARNDILDLPTGLFWTGSAPLAVMTLYTVAGWIVNPCADGSIDPSWMNMPTANMVSALTARLVSEDYVEWGWFLFGLGVILWLAIWPITFRSAVSNHHSDVRSRNLYGVWVTPPAIAFIAYANLTNNGVFDNVERMLFYPSIAMAIVLAFCTWPMNFFLEGEFNMSVWSFGFDALAAAAVMVYDFTRYDAMQVVYVVALCVSCMGSAVNMLSTLAALKARHIFIPDEKWSPLFFLTLTHEAFREAIIKLDALTTAVKPGIADGLTLRELSAGWGSICAAQAVHSKHETGFIFPVCEKIFPGQTSTVAREHRELEVQMKSIQSAMDSLLSSTAGSTKGDDARAVRLEALKADVSEFGKLVLSNMEHEELSFVTPVIRKYLPGSTTTALVRQIWDATSYEEMTHFLGWVLSNLRIRDHRTKFLKTWIWAMPERAQVLGLMVYRVVNDIVWVEVARDLPQVIPRGLPGYRRYF